MKNICIVLYSGGCDSTLAAALVSGSYAQVELVTYDRLGFFKAQENASINFEKLKKKFGQDKLSFRVFKVDSIFKKIQYDRYLYYLKKYGSICMSICGLCKLAMHCQTILYCIRHSIANVCDGASREMSVFPTQNLDIALEGIKKLYADFGINYFNPVFENGKDAEKMLYDMGIIPTRAYRLKPEDKQVLCSQQILFARFVGYYLSEHSWEEYVRDLHNFYSEKIADIEKNISLGFFRMEN